MKALAILLLLYSSTVFSEPYYGYYGNCNNPIHKFDFKNEKYEAYIEEFKYTKNGKEKTYRFIKGKLRKKSDNKFILEKAGREPLTIHIDPTEELLWGENKEYEKHWYKPCNFKKIPELIENAKKHS